MYGGQACEQFWEDRLQFLQRESTFGPKIQAHLGFLQPRIFEEDDSFGMKVGIFSGSMLGKAQSAQR
jgi:hypothetical protein